MPNNIIYEAKCIESHGRNCKVECELTSIHVNESTGVKNIATF